MIRPSPRLELPPATPEERAFMEEMERTNGGDGSFVKGAPPGEFAAMGRRWAETNNRPNLHPYVLYDLTDGAEGEPPPGDSYRFRSWAHMASSRIKEGSGERLAELYLEKTGLSARDAELARNLVEGTPLIRADNLPPEDAERYTYVRGRLYGLHALARLFLPPSLTGPTGARPDAPAEDVLTQYAEYVTAADAERLREVIRSLAERVEREDAPGLFIEWTMAPSSPDPEIQAVREELEALEARATMNAEQRTASLDRLLTGSGERHPDPVAWIDASPWKHIRGIMLSHLDKLARREGELRLRELEEQNKRLRAELEAQQQAAETATGIVQLGDRLSLPRPAVDVARKDGRGFTDLLGKIDQGDLFPVGEGTLAVLREAEVMVERRQFAELSTPEIRGLCGVFRVFSSVGDNGREFTGGSVLSVDARTMYDACGVDARQPKSCKDLFDALRKLSEREIYVPLTFQDGDRLCVIGDRTTVCQVRPVWNPEKREDAEAIARAWVQQKEGAEWTGPLPDKYVLTLPPIMRKVWGALVVSADVLQRLEEGAKQGRGTGQGFRPIDWALFLEVTQTTQAQQLADNLLSLCSFINRDDFILAHYGREKVESYRKRRHYKTLVAEYEKAARVLVEGGICTSWKPENKGKRGPRDVFTLSPDVVHGLTERAERERTRREARAIAPTKKRRKRTGERGIRREAE